MEQCLVLAARRYDFKDKDNGRQVEGVNLTYVTDSVEIEGDRRGCSPMSVAAPSSVWSKLSALPGLYDLDFKQRPGRDGKPTLQLVDVRYVGAVELFDVPKS